MIKVNRPKSASVSGFEGQDRYSHTGYSTPSHRKSEIDVEYTSDIHDSEIDAEEFPGMESFLRRTVAEPNKGLFDDLIYTNLKALVKEKRANSRLPGADVNATDIDDESQF